MSLGSGIAIAGIWLAASAVICVIIVFRPGAEWAIPACVIAAWWFSDNVLEAGHRDDCDEDDEKDSRGADPARS